MKSPRISTTVLAAVCAACFHLAGCANAQAPATTTKTGASTPDAPKPAKKDSKVITTASGLQMEDTKVGAGAEAKAGVTVSVHYTGWLFNDGVQGAKFDSSKDRGQPFQFSLGAGQVIKGWDEGVQGMSVGGTRRLVIPAELGYGARGAGGVIPPNATLLFEVDFLG